VDRFFVECVDDPWRKGPVDPLPTNAAKIFASVYALFSGLAFIGIVSVLLAPFVHRMLHRIHAEEQ
jgi:hypothetical protein